MTGWSRSGCGCTRTRPGSSTARTARGVARTNTPPYLPGVHAPGALGAAKERQQVLGVPARDQQGCPEEDQRCSPLLATAPPHHPHLRRTRQGRKSGGGGLDAVLRRVPPLRAASPPGAHQRLPRAMDPQEIPTTPSTQDRLSQATGDHQEISPHVRAMARVTAMPAPSSSHASPGASSRWRAASSSTMTECGRPEPGKSDPLPIQLGDVPQHLPGQPAAEPVMSIQARAGWVVKGRRCVGAHAAARLWLRARSRAADHAQPRLSTESVWPW